MAVYSEAELKCMNHAEKKHLGVFTHKQQGKQETGSKAKSKL